MSFLSRKQAEHEYALEVEAPQMARVTALLYACGAVFVSASIALPHPQAADTSGLWLVALIAFTASVSIFALAENFKTWSIHTVLLVGSGLISTCVSLSGSASGIYAAMFIWVVLVAARSFSIYGLVFQLLGILATYGIALLTLTAGPDEFALVTRWLLSVFALCVTGVISLRLVSDARKKEAELIRLTGPPKRNEAPYPEPSPSQSPKPQRGVASAEPALMHAEAAPPDPG
jgi:hypothetical protein